MVTGNRSIQRKLNTFSSSGVWLGNWEENNKGIWFKTTDGKYYKNAWKSLGDSWYYFDKSGYRQYMAALWNKSGYVTTGWKKLNNNWYYFDELGRMNDEQYSYINGKEYRFNKSGSLYTGWYDEGYYIDYDWETGEHLETEIWKKDWKYYTANGSVTSSWRKVDNNWYYFNYNGSMVTGEDYIDGEWHEFADNGIWIGKVTN